MNREMIQIINTILALSVLPPSIILIGVVLRERFKIAPEQRSLNRGLAFTYLGTGITAVVNSGVALLAVMDSGRAAHCFSPYGRAIVNLAFLVATWLMYRAYLEIKK
jgi:hypothetical protein